MSLDRARIQHLYEADALQYLKSLPLEHFMESPAQAMQREITLESFALVRAYRPDIQVFSELLVHYNRPGDDPDEPSRVVPDNMVVVHPTPLKLGRSFIASLQPVGPLLVMEYVSASNPRKDYDDNRVRYEQELSVPYYLLFHPETKELLLFHLVDSKYVVAEPNRDGRLPIPELELEVRVLDGWTRYWFRGKLLDLPADLLHRIEVIEAELTSTKHELTSTKHELTTAKHELTTAKHELTSTKHALLESEQQRLAAEAEIARLREELAKLKPSG